MEFVQIAHIESDFAEKFGIPRQSGLVPQLKARIVFEEDFCDPKAVDGLKQFSHIWLIWEFSKAVRGAFTPTVRPPRLGGNERMGVFATRSPFRPNPVGLSCVKLDEVALEEGRPVLYVSGADLLNGTPIFDIKPYIAYTDSHPEAECGFAQEAPESGLRVSAGGALLEKLPPDKREGLLGVLMQDPRPAYQSDPDRVYGMNYAGYNVKFRVSEGELKIIDIAPNADRSL